MKKKVISLLLSLLLLFAVVLPVAAAQPRVVDDAGLLTSQEAAMLESYADEIALNYDMDAVIVTVDSLDGKSAESYADDYFDFGGYGIGSDASGILLLVSMNEREWAVSTCGNAIAAVTGSEIDDILDDILDDLSDGDYYRAFNGFLSRVEKQYEGGISGTGVDIGDILMNLLVALGIGAAVAAVVLVILLGKMNTARPQSGAKSYMNSGSYDLYRSQDIYLYSNTSKVRKSDNNSGGHGGGTRRSSSGGTHRSSSGRSHGGRSGRF